MSRDDDSPDALPCEDAAPECDACPVDCSAYPVGRRRSRPAVGFRGDRRAEIERRDVAKLLATVGGLAAVGSLAAPLAGIARVFEGEPAGPVYEEGVALVDEDGERIEENRLAVGEHLTVFPETDPTRENAPTLLVRFEESAYGEGTELAFTVDGYAAYSKVCTHAGCLVDDWEDAVMICPCHGGRFDPRAGAVVVAGPPPRPLPQLPITLAAAGHLVATGPFPAPIGPGGE